MLEALVSSRIRRTLLEHLLTHSHDRFYLRGLARELGLSVSPLRRELKRLEQTGVLRAFQEGNMLFYTVDAASPVFQQLKQAGLPAPRPTDYAPARQAGQPAPAILMGGPVPTEAPSHLSTTALGARPPRLWWKAGRGGSPAPALVEGGPAGFARPGFREGRAGGASAQPAPALVQGGPGSPQPSAQSPQVIPIGIVSANSVARVWRNPLRGPALVGITAAGIALMLLMTGFFYLTMTNERLASAIKRALTAKPTSVTVVAPPASSSGVMRSSRWQIVPGGFGGFSSGASNESY